MASWRTIGPIAHVSSLQGPVVTKKSVSSGSVQIIIRVTESIGGVRGREHDNLPASAGCCVRTGGCRMGGTRRFPILFPFEAFFVPGQKPNRDFPNDTSMTIGADSD